jgi:hypothetical protein
MKIFISYDYSNDRHYKNLLLAWDANKEFDFEFQDMSADISINSREAEVIKRAIAAKIGISTHFLCLVGREAAKSSWIDWEIRKAVELRRKIVAVKIDRSYMSPSALLGAGAGWALSFTFEAIRKALKEA